MRYLTIAILPLQQIKKALSTAMMAAALLFSTASNAALIPLNLEASPDIFSSFITVNYNAGTDLLTASGFATAYFDGISGNGIEGGSFSLNATITDAGILSGGSLNIGGTIAALGFNSGTLLSGVITALGFDGAGGDPLEFLFSVTGGDLAAAYGGVGGTGGTILTNSGLPAGLFANNFQNAAFSGLADVGVPVPEPAGLLLLSSGLLGLIVLRRRRG
ncbi:MAG: PEP-CTERM sorting domain-containing protein [Paraglaciecola polaris]|uniref:PEP-CTERM sorting domain-containing protein n=1 Tax=Paraglaciecola polaris TaxID=222814 RepID=UPI0030014AB5|tara:strand:+ start:432 stop:1085 length:654 start_codon:yes stop_codon:yes gene_type:complete